MSLSRAGEISETSVLRPARVNPILQHPLERRVSLSGLWQFALDPEDIGVKEHWYENPDAFSESIRVPGCWQGQGFGHDGTDRLWDFQLATRVFRATYRGTGWYARKFPVPREWSGGRLWLNFGGAHPSADVWVNGRHVGENSLPFVPFAFEVTDQVNGGEENRVVARVHEHNRLFGLAYNWQGNWSGLYRDVELTGTGPAYLDRFCVHTDAENGDVTFQGRIGGDCEGECVVSVSMELRGAEEPVLRAEFSPSAGDFEWTGKVADPDLWSPDTPDLYRVDVVLRREGAAVPLDARSERVGFVHFDTDGHHFRINGEPYYMRGTGDFLSCPETGCPDTSRERWRRKLRTLRGYGYNYVRCQSYLYPPEYFDAADEVGLLVQSEMGMLGAWGGHTPEHVYQWPKPTPDNHPILRQQWNLSVLRDVNHPSASLYCMSNECGGDTDFHRTAWQCCRETKAIKPTAQVIWTDGGYNPDLPADFYNDQADKDLPGDRPLIQHEFRWWSSFPDVRLADRYHGAVRPYTQEIARRAAAQKGQEHLLEEYADNSMRLQFIEAKGQMEARRRDFPDLAGICHFNAMDTNPSPQGMVNEFYEPKLVDAATWLRTNGDTVVLCELGFGDRVVEGGAEFECEVSVSDFSHPPFEHPEVRWELRGPDDGLLVEGSFEWAHRPFRTHTAGQIRFLVPEVKGPRPCRLRAELVEAGRSVENEWSLWLFPPTDAMQPIVTWGEACDSWLADVEYRKVMEIPSGAGGPSLLFTECLDEPLLDYIRAGGCVFLAATEGLVRPHPPNFGTIKYFFTPPANYGPYEDGQNGTVIREHPLLGDFPHEGFADLPFYRMMRDSPPLDLEPLGLHDADPIIRVIHRYPVCRPLGYLVERRIGQGRLIISALDLDPSRAESRCLLGDIMRYAVVERKPPAPEVSGKKLRRLTEATSFGTGS